MVSENGSLLAVKDLRLYFKTRGGIVQAVDKVDFKLTRTHATVIIGESGCGKSSLAKAILRLLPRNIETYDGEVLLSGEDIMGFSDEEFRSAIRWKRISMVPQAAMNALNPVMRIGDQVAEPAMVHLGLSKKDAIEQAAHHVRPCRRTH